MYKRQVYNRAVDRHLAPYVPHHFRYVYTGTRADRKRALDKEDMAVSYTHLDVYKRQGRYFRYVLYPVWSDDGGCRWYFRY